MEYFRTTQCLYD